jgi:general L-amino acid transport system permease protein
MTQTNSLLPPLTERSGVLRWLRKNLFGSWPDAILTIVGALIIYWAVKGFLTWAFTVAEWEVVSANMRLFMIGQYPIKEVGGCGLPLVS